jgi:hypothetical protein
MDQDEDQRTAPELREPQDGPPAQDLPEQADDLQTPDDGADYGGLPKSVFGRAMLALLAVFWIVAVIMLFTQGGK